MSLVAVKRSSRVIYMSSRGQVIRLSQERSHIITLVEIIIINLNLRWISESDNTKILSKRKPMISDKCRTFSLQGAKLPDMSWQIHSGFLNLNVYNNFTWHKTYWYLQKSIITNLVNKNIVKHWKSETSYLYTSKYCIHSRISHTIYTPKSTSKSSASYMLVLKGKVIFGII